MTQPPGASEALCLTSLSHLRDKRLRRILNLAGYHLRLGTPRPGDGVAVWGHRPTAKRGEALSQRYGAPLIRLEDAFLRSLTPGRAGGNPIGLILDKTGMYFDASRPSDLENILTQEPLGHSDDLARAKAGIALMRSEHLTKYTAFDPNAAVPDPGYVLVIDQTRGDASVSLGGANANHFAEMLTEAQLDHPTARIIIKGHPEARLGLRKGYFSVDDQTDRISYFDGAVSPWALLDGAIAVYVVTSQLGFEAILAGHRPQVFGKPFYAGWGLSEDRFPVIGRRGRKLTRNQLFIGAMLKYPLWYDPHRDRLGRFEDAAYAMAAEARAWRQDHRGHVATGIRLWKRGALARFQGHGPLRFDDTPARAVAKAAKSGQPLMVWAGKETDHLQKDSKAENVDLIRVEDGFLRSCGLGASLVPPMSLVWDRQGIYYDPTRPSDIENAIAEATRLPRETLSRAQHLRERIVALGLSKYNLQGTLPVSELPTDREIILVPGQVEDDASILRGGGKIRKNQDLLAHARATYPGAFVIYKPHPDVEAGLRPGVAAQPGDADLVAFNTAATALIDRADRVVTMTSLLGFEALMRRVRVTTLGTPFYAGWGLSHDLDLHPAAKARRQARPSLDALVHGALIRYPRYFDPVTRQPCPPEIVVERLAAPGTSGQPFGHKILAKAQGALASYSWIWR